MKNIIQLKFTCAFRIYFFVFPFFQLLQVYCMSSLTDEEYKSTLKFYRYLHQRILRVKRIRTKLFITISHEIGSNNTLPCRDILLQLLEYMCFHNGQESYHSLTFPAPSCKTQCTIRIRITMPNVKSIINIFNCLFLQSNIYSKRKSKQAIHCMCSSGITGVIAAYFSKYYG
jgi:hypothetical protein